MLHPVLEPVLIREVYLFQRLISTQRCAIGTSEAVLNREVSLVQRQELGSLVVSV